MPDKKQYVPPFSKDDIVEIIKEAVKNGTICSEKQAVDNTKTYTLKLDKGNIKLVEDVE